MPDKGIFRSGTNRNEHDDDDTETEGLPVSSFQSYAAEADILAKQGDYRKAIDAYTKVSEEATCLALVGYFLIRLQQALNMRPMEKHVLVSRSKCYLQLGDSQKSLEDAQMSLKEDPEFFKVQVQKISRNASC